jgi:regulator of sigma E protease
MLGILSDILAFIVAISLLVAVHEFGHFWVARLLGFKVLRYSIGFGRPLVTWTPEPGWLRRLLRLERRSPAVGVGGSAAALGFSGPFARGRAESRNDRVEYWISAIPLGGYVKMLDEREGPVAEEERHRAFNRRPIPHRIAVLLAGPGFNFLFALLAYWVMFVQGVPGVRAFVSDVQEGSVAAEAGLRAGDIIESIGGRSTETWETGVVAIIDQLLADGVIDMRVIGADGDRRNVELDVRGRASELTEPDALFDGLGMLPGPQWPAEITEVDADSPAARGGFEAGDRIVSAGGEPILGWGDLLGYVQQRPGETVPFEIDRDGERLALTVEVGEGEIEGERVGLIGVRRPEQWPEEIIERVRIEQQYSLVGAAAEAGERTWEMTTLTLRLLGRMVTGDVSLRNASGPIMIAVYAGDSAEAGLTAFLSFLSLISISLGIMNLLPIPILDGGQIVYQLAEAFKGSPLSERAMVFGQQVGLALLLALMTFVFYNDISRLLG